MPFTVNGVRVFKLMFVHDHWGSFSFIHFPVVDFVYWFDLICSCLPLMKAGRLAACELSQILSQSPSRSSASILATARCASLIGLWENGDGDGTMSTLVSVLRFRSNQVRSIKKIQTNISLSTHPKSWHLQDCDVLAPEVCQIPRTCN